MDKRIIVFDFDGTLIDSNPIKYNAYFKLFPDTAFHRTIIKKILKTYFEKSRFFILELIIRQIGSIAESDIDAEVKKIANLYNDIVLEGAKTCAEAPWAEAVLEKLYQRYPVYLSSTTPEIELKKIIRFRNWEIYFKDIYGFPRDKTETLQMILREEGGEASELIVIGDGESDRVAACNAGCRFFQVNATTFGGA